MANPTWYDILGVGRDATAAEIKAAWRDATDKFEPGSGQTQFRLFNEAADVLLDADRRAAYDAELDGTSAAAVEPAAEPAPEPVAEPTPEPELGPEASPEPDAPVDAEPAIEEPPAAERGGAFSRLSWYAVALLGVVTAAVVALVVVLAINIQGKVDVANAAAAAQSAADRAMVPAISYDYRRMDADRDRAASYMTPKFKKEFIHNFGLLTQAADGEVGPAVKLKAVVSADVLASGVIEAAEDRVEVLVFVNQSSVKGEGQPTIFQNRVVLTMVLRDGAWLIDDITTY